MSADELVIWNQRVALVHGVSSLVTFAMCAVIAFVAFYIIARGHVRTHITFAALWKLSALFVLLCALSNLGAFLEIAIGGRVYWITGVNKALMAIASAWFAMLFYRLRGQFVLICRLLEQLNANASEEEK